MTITPPRAPVAHHLMEWAGTAGLERDCLPGAVVGNVPTIHPLACV